jgi:hypothetical protein
MFVESSMNLSFNIHFRIQDLKQKRKMSGKIGKKERTQKKTRGLPKIITGPRAKTLSERKPKQAFQTSFRMHARTEWLEMNGDLSGLEARCNAVETNEMRDLVFFLTISVEDLTKAEALQHFVEGLEDLDCDADTCEVLPSKSLNAFLNVIWEKTGWEVVGEIESVVPSEMMGVVYHPVEPSVFVARDRAGSLDLRHFDCNMNHGDFDAFFATLPAVSMVKSASKEA